MMSKQYAFPQSFENLVRKIIIAILEIINRLNLRNSFNAICLTLTLKRYLHSFYPSHSCYIHHATSYLYLKLTVAIDISFNLFSWLVAEAIDYLMIWQCQLFQELTEMYLPPKRFPPLATRKPSHQLKLHPTVLSLHQHHTRPTIDSSISRQHTPHSQQTNQEIAIEQPSLRRQHTSIKSVSSARNSSCSQLGRTKAKAILVRGLEQKEMPFVSAKSWLVYEMREGRSLWGRRESKKREMASLTKMMNLVAILHLVQQAGVDPKKVTVTATRNATTLNGTSAELRRGAAYSLYDLFFGMMLPSGNDAAYLIAEVGGAITRMMREGSEVKEMEDPAKLQEAIRRGNNVSLFLKEMNRLGLQLGMGNSNFANPHGLSNPANYSSALDLAKLCAYAMKDPLFRKIVNTQRHYYRCRLPLSSQADKENLNPNRVEGNCEKEWLDGRWENTNRMLGEGWSGIKTGVTPNAGPCLAASVSMILGGKQYDFLVVLLQSESMEARWTEVKQIVQWVIQSRLYLAQ